MVRNGERSVDNCIAGANYVYRSLLYGLALRQLLLLLQQLIHSHTSLKIKSSAKPFVIPFAGCPKND